MVLAFWVATLHPYGLVLAQSDPNPAATRQYAAAVALQNREVFDLAGQEWKKFLKEFPDDPRADRASHYLGVCYLKSDRYAEAAEAFQDALRRFPQSELSETSQLYRGIAQYSQARDGKPDEFDQARKTFDALLKAFPQGKSVPQALFYEGECLYGQGHKAEAAARYARMLEKYPQHSLASDALYALAVAQQETGQTEAAAANLDRFLEQYPDNPLVPEARVHRGEAAVALGQFEQAAEQFGQAASAKDFALADLATARQAVALAQLGRYGEAAELYESIPKRFPKSKQTAGARLAAGKCYHLGGNFPKARAILESLLTDPKQGPEAAHWVARSLLKENRPAEALAVAEKALAAIEKDVPVDKKALATASQGGADKTDSDPGRKVSPLPPAGEGQGVRAGSSDRSATSGRPPAPLQLLLDQADAAYEIPDQRRRSVGLYAALAAQGSPKGPSENSSKKHPGQAEPGAAKKDASEPKDSDEAAIAQAGYMAAFAALGLADYEAALKYAEDFLARHPENALAVEVKYVAAEARLHLGQPAEAAKLYGELLRQAPKHVDAETWRVREGLSLYLDKKYDQAQKLLQGVVGQIKKPASLAEAHYLIGSCLTELGKPKEAIAELQASLDADPRWSQADATWLALAEAYRRNQQSAESTRALRKLIAEFPKSAQCDRALYQLGATAYADGDWKTAASEYRTLLDQSPDSPLAPQALYGLAWSELNLGHAKSVEDAVATLLKRFPNDKQVPGARYARGVVRHQQKLYAPAIEDFQAMLASKPEGTLRSEVRYALALCEVGLARWDQAVADLEKILHDDPDYAGTDKVLYELAWAQKSRGKEALATEAFARLVEKCPKSPLAAESYFHVGEAAYGQGEFPRAAEAYRAAVERAGQTPLGEKAAHKLGWAWFRAEDYGRAAEAFAQQRQRWPEGASLDDGTFLEAECLFKQEKYDEALKLYTQVHKPTGKDFGVLALLHGAQSAAQVKQWDQSRRMLEEAAQRFAQSDFLPEILCEEGWALQNLGRRDEAIKLYRQVVEKTAREAAARAQFMIGEIQFQNQQHAEAVKSFFTVAYGYSYPKWQAEAIYESARCFEILKMKGKARNQYRELIQKFPANEKVTAAREALERLGSGD